MLQYLEFRDKHSTAFSDAKRSIGNVARANEQLTDERRMWFRIGVNVGDVMVKDGDIFGDGVNIAARIEGLAEPGGICISRGVHDHVMRKFSYRFEDLGEKSVKNIAQPIRVFRLICEGGPAALDAQRSLTPLWWRRLRAPMCRRSSSRCPFRHYRLTRNRWS